MSRFGSMGTGAAIGAIAVTVLGVGGMGIATAANGGGLILGAEQHRDPDHHAA